MAGQGRPLALSDRYPDATQVAETRKSFEVSTEPGRFGTEGSEVQILSPRPLFTNKITKIQSAGTLGSTFEISCGNRMIGASDLG